jgi:hypothetical protein
VGATGQFESFRRVVLADPALQARLRSIPDWPTFVAAAVDAAVDRGIGLTEADILAARAEAWQSWLERWI